MGSSIAPTQPLGFNYVGGKLMALLTCSDSVVDAWDKLYNKETLAGITTTSLYGTFSQYTRLNYWRKCGKTLGTLTLEPSDATFKLIKDYINQHYKDEFQVILDDVKAKTKSGILSHPKTRMLQFLYTKLGIGRLPTNNAPRGVYWCALYDNTNEFLRCETDELGNKKFDNSVETLTELWKEKYAAKRLKNLMENNKYNKDTLFYDDMIKLDWEQSKKKYLQDVGR